MEEVQGEAEDREPIRNIRQPVPALQAIERQTERAGAEEGQHQVLRQSLSQQFQDVRLQGKDQNSKQAEYSVSDRLHAGEVRLIRQPPVSSGHSFRFLLKNIRLSEQEYRAKSILL